MRLCPNCTPSPKPYHMLLPALPHSTFNQMLVERFTWCGRRVGKSDWEVSSWLSKVLCMKAHSLYSNITSARGFKLIQVGKMLPYLLYCPWDCEKVVVAVLSTHLFKCWNVDRSKTKILECCVCVLFFFFSFMFPSHFLVQAWSYPGRLHFFF